MKKTILAPALLAFLFFSCGNQETNSASMQTSLDSLNKQLILISDIQKKNEFNKKLVADFYQKLFGDKNINAIDEYIGEMYIQHNPMLPDGKDALKQGFAQWFKDAPKEEIDIQHIGADGDLVYIHTRAKMGGKTASIIDIFRIENGKIAEHWDVIQEVPEKSANPHPMF